MLVQVLIAMAAGSSGPSPRGSRRGVVYLSPADKYHRLIHRPSQEHKGLDERALRASQRASHSW